MSKFRKYHFCSICEEDVLVVVEGIVDFPPPYAIGASPGPDFVRAKMATCEVGHELGLVEAQEILEGIAAGEVF